MYLSASAALLLLANHAIAQSSSVISIWAFDLDAPTLLASLVDANPTANVLAIQCPPGTDSAVCDVPGVVTITEGPSTLRAVYTVAADVVYRASETFISGSVTVTLECARRVVTQAVCTYAGEGEGVTTSTVITVTDTDISSVPVTITAGLEKLASTASAAGAQATDAGLSGSVPSGTGRRSCLWTVYNILTLYSDCDGSLWIDQAFLRNHDRAGHQFDAEHCCGQES